MPLLVMIPTRSPLGFVTDEARRERERETEGRRIEEEMKRFWPVTSHFRL